VVLVRILLAVIGAVLRAVALAFWLLVSMGAWAILIVVVIGLAIFLLTSALGLGLSRRRANRSN
jgi:hypothetical protein